MFEDLKDVPRIEIDEQNESVTYTLLKPISVDAEGKEVIKKITFSEPTLGSLKGYKIPTGGEMDFGDQWQIIKSASDLKFDSTAKKIKSRDAIHCMRIAISFLAESRETN